ncbi:unnamed protein product [Knipowitschia caucasica]|uniref:Glycoprotein hormone subunit beta domain-containing protein n=1 Tax=Knipowitschia caucasica TaxID=637954 RepID=A0AAV2LSU6_KNICA
MQLVFTVTVALVAVVTTVTMMTMVGAECGGNRHCHKVTRNITVTACGVSQNVETTVCEGNCYNQDTVQPKPVKPMKQKVCVGHWEVEKKEFKNCFEAVPIWRAHNCSCGSCLTQKWICEGHDPCSF